MKEGGGSWLGQLEGEGLNRVCPGGEEFREAQCGRFRGTKDFWTSGPGEEGETGIKSSQESDGLSRIPHCQLPLSHLSLGWAAASR